MYSEKITFVPRDDWVTWGFEIMLRGLKNATYLFGRPKWMHTAFTLLDKIEHYGPMKTMNQLKCDVIYEDLAVSSARFHGVKGLGTELTLRSEELAKERGCTHTHAIVTGEAACQQTSTSKYESLILPPRQVLCPDL